MLCFVGGSVPLVLSASEGGPAETSLGPVSEVATSGSSGGAESANPENREGPAEGASFVHTAADANSRGDYTYLSHPRIDGDPDAVVLVSSTEGAGGEDYGHNVGVWFEPRKEKWAIFNQDLAPVPTGATFGVAVPRADRGFVHRAEPANTEGDATYLDDPLLDGNPDAEVSVTQNWNPGGGNGVYNDHPVGVGYDEDVERWFVRNGDGARVPEGAAFNVAVGGGVSDPQDSGRLPTVRVPPGQTLKNACRGELPRTPSARSSENDLSTHSAG